MLFYDKLNSHLKGTKLGINYYKPGEIPDAKANNIRKKAGINKDEQLLALIDMSLMKSGKAGIAFTDKGIHIKTMLSHARFVSYEDLAVSEVYALDNTLNINNSNMQYSSTSLPDDVNTKQLIQLIKNIKLSKMKSEGIRLRKPPIEIKKIAGLALRSILYFLIILLVFDFFSTTEKTFIESVAIVAFLALFYLVVYLICKGIIFYMIAVVIVFAVLSGLSAVFPPLGLLLALFIIGLIFKKLKAIIYLIPWVMLGVPLYYGAHQVFTNNIPFLQQPFLVEYYIAPILVFSIFVAYRYNLWAGLFKVSVVFVGVPLIALYLFLDDVDDYIDDSGIDYGVDGDDSVFVNEYNRSDGTVVSAHTRSLPNV